MNLMLAIDTSQGTSVAVLRDGKLLAEISEPSTMLHAEQIGPLISRVLDQSQVRAKNVSLVVVGQGPAPFTGLRVGIAAAKLFAKGCGAKLYGVSSLDAIAFSLNLEKATLVVTDARRGEVYFALYKGKSPSGVPTKLMAEGVQKLEDLKVALERDGISYELATGDVSAEKVGGLANALMQEGKAVLGASANYLRAPDAVEPKGKKVSG